ncbi:MAG: hypothetical protein IPG42_01085 [Betaproteobacteria bacterium]|nr:hypothetical protein [Betaproteobacteria bacterium]
MRFLGFEVYQASQWTSPGFMASAYPQTTFALELQYLRDFKGADIAKRSIAEMLRQAPLATEGANPLGRPICVPCSRM